MKVGPTQKDGSDRTGATGLKLMMEGIPVPIIQQQLGHASLATTNTYLVHIAPKDVIETMGKREWSPD